MELKLKNYMTYIYSKKLLNKYLHNLIDIIDNELSLKTKSSEIYETILLIKLEKASLLNKIKAAEITLEDMQ